MTFRSPAESEVMSPDRLESRKALLPSAGIAANENTTPGEDLLPLGRRQARHEERVEDDHEHDPGGGDNGESENPTVGVDESYNGPPSAPDRPGQTARHRGR